MSSLPNLSQVHFAELQEDVDGFEGLAHELKQLTGINLPTNTKNISLMAGRLSSLLSDHNIDGYAELLKRIKKREKALINSFVFSMTTNTTQFFREKAHFSFLAEILPKILEVKRMRGETDIRIWCAAASSGQEPYSLLMAITPFLNKIDSPSLKFLASDIDRDVLNKASRGIYSDTEMVGVDDYLRQHFFTKSGTDQTQRFQVKNTERSRITFAPLNLIDDRYPFKYQFDIVFCRNVLIYFDKNTCQKVIANIMAHVGSGGYLFLGHAESGIMRYAGVKAMAHAVYQKG